MQNNNDVPKGACLTRRAFLFRSSTAVAGTIMLPALTGMGCTNMPAELVRYPRQKIGQLSKLKTNKPVTFNYPDEGMNSSSTLIRLGVPAGGGIGRDGDVVAFNSLCTHMGGPMGSTYQPADQALGPCPFHQSTFDLTRHGMIISGHATESLPQVLLELEGDDIYAVGLIGLIYGRYDNLKS